MGAIARAYNDWYRIHREALEDVLDRKDHTLGNALTAEVVRYSHLRNHVLSDKAYRSDVIIACDDDGELDPLAETMICDYFAENPQVNMLYCDEDRVEEDGVHLDPWFKPEWSPDTFLSGFYFGNIFAIRSAALAMINPGGRSAANFESASAQREDLLNEEKARLNMESNPMRSWIYEKLCLKLAQADGGFSRRPEQEWDIFPVGHIPEILFHMEEKVQTWSGNLITESLTGRYDRASALLRLISIVIPSKDNPEMLARCVRSIEGNTSVPHEIIIVDNGSTPENRAKVQKLVDELNEDGRVLYLYEEMPFNMPRFYNLGAAAASGEMLLFMHDDVIIQTKGWLSHLSEKAKLPYVGAVGMKLLYPNSNIIEHAGIISVEEGPVYKLQYCRIDESYYFDFNKGVRNVLALSGACIMVRGEIFREVGGFDEEHFPNYGGNMDFCYRIFEKGYYNVVRNNMYLYYYESYSPENGATREERELHRPMEIRILQERHPKLARRDPFYHQYLTQDVREPKFKVELSRTGVPQDER